MRPIPLVSVCVLLVAGCNFNGMPKEFSDAGRAIATSMMDQAVWQEITANVRGHAANPGLRTGAGVEYYAYARIEGFDGDIGAAGKGGGSGELTPDARAAIIRTLSNTSNLDPAVARLLNGLLRGEPDFSDPPPGGTAPPTNP